MKIVFTFMISVRRWLRDDFITEIIVTDINNRIICIVILLPDLKSIYP